MSTNDYKDGWGVVDADGLDIATVGPTRRSAIVNWLVVKAKVMVYNHNSNDWIEKAWEANCGDAVVRPVRMYVQ